VSRHHTTVAAPLQREVIMSQSDRLAGARRIMEWFARSTGLEPEGTPRRYLWTDAFAVCNYLGLAEATGDDELLGLAIRLVDQVHHVLGRHRPDDARRGWISGLEGDEAERHPTAGGLRIGKLRAERAPDEPLDPEAEWDRDGQYFHYLTRWMWALGRVSRVTGESRYHAWAVELAGVAYRAFAYPRDDGVPRHLSWKMSVDLSRPLVASTGQHDALDGFVTMSCLQAMAPEGRPVLVREVSELEGLCRDGAWATADALGIGGLLTDGWRLVQLALAGRQRGRALLASVLDQARWSLDAVGRSRALRGGAAGRLPFRELGLSIGLAAVARIAREATSGSVRVSGPVLESLARHVPLRGAIESFWVDPGHREAETWTGHRDINAVMLATSLAPDGYLDL